MADEQNKSEDLAPGTWVTEATGFASVPPRAQSDLSAVCADNPADDSPADVPLDNPDAERTAETAPENELMMSRGEEDRS